MDRIKLAMKPVASPVFRSTRLSEQARERTHSQYYNSLRAAKNLYAAGQGFVRWRGLRHPRNDGRPGPPLTFSP